mmetsp:Transcript_28355/g.61618  ORF Transcript_28355/g.61618 Transcript_28355/m.61618 type:complete len:85 (-) Transcript_28355:306-560(-)
MFPDGCVCGSRIGWQSMNLAASGIRDGGSHIAAEAGNGGKAFLVSVVPDVAVVDDAAVAVEKVAEGCRHLEPSCEVQCFGLASR